MISETIPEPMTMPSFGNSRLATNAPAMPTRMSPMMPKPVPRTILPASQPAIRPTNKITRMPSLEICIGNFPLLVRAVTARTNRGEFPMQISNEGILVILFVGLIAGWLAGKIVRGTGFGIIGDILVGIAGAFVASLLFPKLGIVIGSGIVSEIIYSAIGAIILLLIVRLLRTGGRF